MGVWMGGQQSRFKDCRTAVKNKEVNFKLKRMRKFQYLFEGNFLQHSRTKKLFIELLLAVLLFRDIPPGVNFIKALMPAFFYWRENANKIILVFKTPLFWATCCQFKRFCCPFWCLSCPFWCFYSQICSMKLNF